MGSEIDGAAAAGSRRVLVVGGGGFIGRRVVAALAAEPGVETAVGGRRGPLVVDLDQPSTFAVFDRFDAVVDCADTTVAPPDEAASYCLRRGITFLETTAETASLARLFENHRRSLAAELRAKTEPARGLLVLGLGLFPGLSNLLAAELARSRPEPPRRLEVAVRLALASGAGRGTVRAGVELLAHDALRYEGGRLEIGPPLAAGPTLSFPGGRRRTLEPGLPEALMLHWSTGIESTAAYLAAGPVPPGIGLAGALLRRSGAARSVARTLAGWLLGGLRCGLLRRRPVAVELAAWTDRGTAAEAHRALSFADGAAAAAAAIAAATLLLTGSDRPEPGCWLLDEVLTLDPLLARIGER